MNKFVLVLTATVLAGNALAQANATPTTIYLNGQATQATKITMPNGTPALQITVSDLQQAGALTAGPAAQHGGMKACKNQELSNGVLRIKLLEAEKEDGNFVATFQVVNVSDEEVLVTSIMNTENLWIADNQGHTAPFGTWDDDASPARSILPGANLTAGFEVYEDNLAFSPTRILYKTNTSYYSSLDWVENPNMEFDLNCQ